MARKIGDCLLRQLINYFYFLPSICFSSSLIQTTRSLATIIYILHAFIARSLTAQLLPISVADMASSLIPASMQSKLMGVSSRNLSNATLTYLNLDL